MNEKRDRISWGNDRLFGGREKEAFLSFLISLDPRSSHLDEIGDQKKGFAKLRSRVDSSPSLNASIGDIDQYVHS